jgi:SAM-dependent methyltransferase
MSHSNEELDAFAYWERQAWEARAAPYAAGVTALTRGGAAPLLDAAGVGAGTRLLDVATGPGVIALAAVARGARVTAVDQSEAMVELAAAAGVDVRRAGAEDLPFDDGAFDAVAAGFLVNHLARPERAMAELARVCRGGGRVAVSVWDVPDANAALGLFGPVAEAAGLSDAAPPGPDSTLYADGDRLGALLAGAGLADVAVERVGWTLSVEPGAWFDAVAEGTPRTGAVLAAATAEQRAAARARYVEVATASFGEADGRVALPAAAVVASGRAPGGARRADRLRAHLR